MSRPLRTFVETGPENLVHEIVSPIIAVRNGREEFVSGTAFMIGRGFALTAHHVISDFVARYEGVRDVESNLNATYEMLVLLT